MREKKKNLEALLENSKNVLNDITCLSMTEGWIALLHSLGYKIIIYIELNISDKTPTEYLQHPTFEDNTKHHKKK